MVFGANTKTVGRPRRMPNAFVAPRVVHIASGVDASKESTLLVHMSDPGTCVSSIRTSLAEILPAICSMRSSHG